MVREWRGVREIAHSGSTAGYRAYLAHYPEAGLSIAMQCNTGSSDYVELGRKFAEVFLADRLTPAPARPQVQPPRLVSVTLDAATREALRGRWHDAETGALVLLEPWDRGVLLRVPYSPVASFTALSADSLQAGSERAIALERDASGRVTALRYHNGRVLNIRFTKVAP
jgi:hypothetical protein